MRTGGADFTLSPAHSFLTAHFTSAIRQQTARWHGRLPTLLPALSPLLPCAPHVAHDHAAARLFLASGPAVLHVGGAAAVPHLPTAAGV